MCFNHSTQLFLLPIVISLEKTMIRINDKTNAVFKPLIIMFVSIVGSVNAILWIMEWNKLMISLSKTLNRIIRGSSDIRTIAKMVSFNNRGSVSLVCCVSIWILSMTLRVNPLDTLSNSM